VKCKKGHTGVQTRIQHFMSDNESPQAILMHHCIICGDYWDAEPFTPEPKRESDEYKSPKRLAVSLLIAQRELKKASAIKISHTKSLSVTLMSRLLGTSTQSIYQCMAKGMSYSTRVSNTGRCLKLCTLKDYTEYWNKCIKEYQIAETIGV